MDPFHVTPGKVDMWPQDCTILEPRVCLLTFTLVSKINHWKLLIIAIIKIETVWFGVDFRAEISRIQGWRGMWWVRQSRWLYDSQVSNLSMFEWCSHLQRCFSREWIESMALLLNTHVFSYLLCFYIHKLKKKTFIEIGISIYRHQFRI